MKKSKTEFWTVSLDMMTVCEVGWLTAEAAEKDAVKCEKKGGWDHMIVRVTPVKRKHLPKPNRYRGK